MLGGKFDLLDGRYASNFLNNKSPFHAKLQLIRFRETALKIAVWYRNAVYSDMSSITITLRELIVEALVLLILLAKLGGVFD